MPSRWAPAPVAAVMALAVLGAADEAQAHDPGQGPDAGRVALDVTSSDGVATVRGSEEAGACSEGPVRLVARRAGATVTAPARRAGCSFAGRLRLPEAGRWFVYAEIQRGDQEVEAWLPVEVSGRSARVRDGDRYAYVAEERASSVTTKYVTGAFVYLLMVALLAGVFLTLRRTTPLPTA